MGSLFWRTIKNHRLTFIFYTIGAILMLWLFFTFYPALSGMSDKYTEIAKAYPESMLKVFKIDSMVKVFSSLENFLALENYSIIWPILLIALAVSWGGSMIAGEIEKGTIEILLSQPLSRLRIFISKYLAGLFFLIVFVFASVLSIVPLSALYNTKIQFANHLSMAIVGGMFGWAVYSLAVFFSAIFSEKGKVYFATTGVIIVMYVLDIIASLKDNLKYLTKFSFFHYYNYSEILGNNSIDSASYWVFIGSALILTILAAWWFKKRDVAV